RSGALPGNADDVVCSGSSRPVEERGHVVRDARRGVNRLRRFGQPIDFWKSAMSQNVRCQSAYRVLVTCLAISMAGLNACGPSAAAPAVSVTESIYREPGSPKPKLESPHDRDAPPAAVSSEVTQEGTWWTNDPPCPSGATLYGGPPPDHSEVGCKTDKGVNRGQYTRFHPNGSKAEQGEYKNHVAIGTWVKWNDRGVKLLETSYESGAQHGVETEWFSDGKLKTQRTYARGK